MNIKHNEMTQSKFINWFFYKRCGECLPRGTNWIFKQTAYTRRWFFKTFKCIFSRLNIASFYLDLNEFDLVQYECAYDIFFIFAQQMSNMYSINNIGVS
jgi:hypothetical protein